jgi:CYTH domain-containing protein
MLDFDQETAARLGFPKLTYAAIERERRWLCRHCPTARVLHSEAIIDLYITGTRLRLRDMRPLDGGQPLRKLTRKADVNESTRLLTSIYLSDEEFALLSALPGRKIQKTRHRLAPMDGVVVSVDKFDGPLDGLILAEAEFDTEAAMTAFPTPDFALREVTSDSRYTGGALAADGMPIER